MQADKKIKFFYPLTLIIFIQEEIKHMNGQVTKPNLFHKDFTLVVIGQIISLFGNAIVRFALPLYLLNVTNSAVFFGIASACSVIPGIILTPIGGIIADRVNKRNIMVILDFSTSALMVIFLLLMGNVNLVVLLIVTLMILYGIQGTYQPAVQASLPALESEKNLLAANAVINQVSTLANILGPVLGGVLYGIWGVKAILILAGLCFFASAIMEIFIHIPFTKRKSERSFVFIAIHDFKESLLFIRREKPIISKIIMILTLLNLFQTSLLLVAMPVVVTQTFGMSEKMYGYGQGAVAIGGLIGGILTGVLADKLKFYKNYRFLLVAALMMFPISLMIYFKRYPLLSTWIMIPCCAIMVASAVIFQVQMMSFVQKQTPEHLVGKVISCVLTLSMCAQPIGQVIYGGLIEQFPNHIHIIFLITALIAVVITFVSKGVFAVTKEKL